MLLALPAVAEGVENGVDNGQSRSKNSFSLIVPARVTPCRAMRASLRCRCSTKRRPSLNLRLRSARNRIPAVAALFPTTTTTVEETHFAPLNTHTLPLATPSSTTALLSLLTPPSSSTSLLVLHLATLASFLPPPSTSTSRLTIRLILICLLSTSMASAGLDEDEVGSAVVVAVEGGAGEDSEAEATG